MMKARIYHVCRAEEPDRLPAHLDVHIDVELPVLPHAGVAIKVTPRGDFLRIDHVTLDATPGGAGVGIHIEEPDDEPMLWSWADMQTEGWEAWELDEVSGQKLPGRPQ